MMDEIEKLLTPDCLGFYDQVEITEIFACLPDKTVINVFTIIVAEDRNGSALKEAEIISKGRIKISKPLKDWTFGIKRYTKNISDVISDLTKLNNQKEWSASGLSLMVGDLEYQSPRFVSPDSFERVPLNNVLKNNFWNGSYVVEWYDAKKLKLQDLMNQEQSDLLQQLSQEIQKYCPIALASVSDRLGNIIFQIPITILMASFYQTRKENNFELKIAWHSKYNPRPLRLNCEMEHDQLINGYFSCEVKNDITIIPMNYDYGLSKGVIWDDENKLILAATRPNSFIRSISFGMAIVEHEPRIFKTDGQEIRVGVVHKQKNNLIGSPSSKVENWTQERLYKDEKEKLRKNRKFVQYKPESNKNMHEQALADIRVLIQQYGENGIWLWDPFLSANDIIKTLFYCPFIGAKLRAITNLDAHTESESNSKIEQLKKQSDIFNNLESNFYGLNLEFRARIGNAGWEFHDRFLIFPDTQQGTLAWSLGTSVNSLGKKHHILQQVDDGQLIADAFMELWNQLDKSDNLLWKHS